MPLLETTEESEMGSLSWNIWRKIRI